MEKRAVRRVKRRITCEYSHDGGAYKGIILDLDPAGLFIRTHATISPGAEIEIHLTTSAVAPAMTLRVQVVRRRFVPTNLSFIINRGLGVRILEAPREYGQLTGVGLLDSPIQIRSCIAEQNGRSNLDSGGSAPLPLKSAPTARPGPVPEPVQNTTGGAKRVSPSIDRSKPREDSSPTHRFSVQTPSPESRRTATAVLVGGDELNEIAEVLTEFGVDVSRREPTDPQLAVLRDVRLIVVSARVALAHTIPLRGAATISIAVCDEASKTTRTMLGRQGFEYLLRQPVHVEALRLLLRYALFDRPDRRAQTRLPFGYEVSWRVGWRRERGTVLEISPDGCRLLSANDLPLGTRIHLKIPGEVAGGRRLKLRGTVIRSSPHSSRDQLECTALAIVFDDLAPRSRDGLTHVCNVFTNGPPVLPTTAPEESENSDSAETHGASVTRENLDWQAAEAPAAEVPNLEQSADDESADTETEEPIEMAAGAIDGAEADSARPGDDTTSDDGSAISNGRRQFSRGRLDREIVEIDTEQRVVQALLGRDLAMGGIRVDPQTHLESGSRLQLAIFDTNRGEPLILHAVVARDEGLAGMVLHFVDLSADDEAHLAEMITALPSVESIGWAGCHTVVPAGILAPEEKSPR